MSTALRVLVVDDCPDNANTLAMLVEELGCDVRVTNDPTTAIETAANFKPHLALFDIGMPTVDGYQLARSLRQSSDLRTTLLIAVSGYSDKAHQARAAEAGFDAYFVKPLRFDELTAALDTVRLELASAIG